MYRTWHLVLVLLLQHAPTIEDSRLCFVRIDAVEEEGTNVPQDGAPLIT
jgi:hypothetical protein